MPRLEATVGTETREDVVAGEFRISVTFRNAGSEPARLNLHQAAHPALVLDVRDRNDKEVLLPPPSAPDAADLEEGEIIPPGDSVSLDYVGFLDRSLEPGEYRVRYFGEFPALGGTKDDPLRSEWLTFSVRRPRGFEGAIPIPGFKPSPEDPRSERPRPPWPLVLDGIINWILNWWRRFWRWIVCLILRVLFRRSCETRSQEFDQARTETISNAPPGSEAWNGTYSWRARFLLTYDEPNCISRVLVRVRLVGTITTAQRTAWETAIEAAWNSRFKLCSDGCCCDNGLPIATDIQFVSSGEHQVVNVGTTTTNMGNWGASDTVDISHEFGHMLGALDEYFTVNGVNWGAGRQPTGAIMNNPANRPVARHYDTIRRAAAGLTGRSQTTVAQSASC
jgi:hypothetical protein